MKASKTRIKIFSTDSTSAITSRVNDWMRENLEAEVHKIDFQVDRAVHVMVVYEPAGEEQCPDSMANS